MRASTSEQDANRAKSEIRSFLKGANKVGFAVEFHTENMSGTRLDRPVLNEIIENAEHGDVILVEKVDRLTRMNLDMFKLLKRRIQDKGLTIVAVDQPMTHSVLSGTEQNGIARVLAEFMIDLAASMARDDYETRAKRQKQGIQKAKAEDEKLKEQGKKPTKYRGRAADTKKRNNIKALLRAGHTVTAINRMTGFSRVTVYKVKAELDLI